ncbi:MAG: hypothetical protein MRJ96_13455 [Nitrospirales bacterium]|nr:hypothetical protein [Nitrospira sp.]MDR4502451.1 hypothetical protein [Nitrospirales bacterium]
MKVTHLILLMCIMLLSPDMALVFAQETSEDLSAQALEECQKGRIAQTRDSRMEHFKRAETIAERAVKANDKNADAHFALFCSLGEQMRIDGEPDFLAIFGYNRMMDALNRTLELNPDHIDAMSSKGTLLVKLPAFFGGDTEKGEELLQEVIKREPTAINARLVIAQNYAERGQHEKAMELAMTALKFAKVQNRKDLIPEAEEVLSNLRNGKSSD